MITIFSITFSWKTFLVLFSLFTVILYGLSSDWATMKWHLTRKPLYKNAGVVYLGLVFFGTAAIDTVSFNKSQLKTECEAVEGQRVVYQHPYNYCVIGKKWEEGMAIVDEATIGIIR